MRIAELAAFRVAIWGWGREGRAALAALRKRLPDQSFALFCSAAEAPGLAGKPGIHVIDQVATADQLSAFDVVIKSPGISAYNDALVEAERRGTRFTSGTALWFDENPEARVVAVTGTKGKSTTSALLAHLLRGLGKRVALAGNIGLPLLELLDQSADIWVIELSSFQTRSAGPVEVAVITNVYEEHLDWHGSRERYVDDKLALASQARSLVVNAQQPNVLQRFSAHANLQLFGGSAGWQVSDAGIDYAGEARIEHSQIPLAGPHNAMNLCAALTAIGVLGEDADAALAHLAGFQALPHRLTDLGQQNGLRWIDDSIATTPQATLEALASLRGQPVIVLIGGYERGLDWSHFVEQVEREPPAAIITMGANGPRIAALLRASSVADRLLEANTLAEAAAAARVKAQPGSTILLSPGAPSFDQFADYAARGRAFSSLAGFEDAVADDIRGLGIA